MAVVFLQALIVLCTTTLFSSSEAFLESFVGRKNRKPRPLHITSVAGRESLPNGEGEERNKWGRPAELENKSVSSSNKPADHLQKKAAMETAAEKPVVMEMDGQWYNLTEWARAHPGGYGTVRKFHGKNATTAFHAVGHSQEAYRLREQFVLVENDQDDGASLLSPDAALTSNNIGQASPSAWKRIRQKLFTKEDPAGVHKCLGLYVLGHFLYRYVKAWSSVDPTAGLGSKTSIWITACFLLPHAALSLSSFLFSVPSKRVVGKSMIWREYRGHNVVFALRSVVCAALATVGLTYGRVSGGIRMAATVASLAAVLCTARAADEITAQWRVEGDSTESTTATMPYWDCSDQTMQRFKSFYAISQYGATLACLAVSNPFWPFMTLLPIQLASFEMTLVRKGFLSVQNFHLIYAASLVLPYIVSLRHFAVTGMVQIPLSFGLAFDLFAMRRAGVNKYGLWSTVGAIRILAGDWILPWQTW